VSAFWFLRIAKDAWSAWFSGASEFGGWNGETVIRTRGVAFPGSQLRAKANSGCQSPGNGASGRTTKALPCGVVRTTDANGSLSPNEPHFVLFNSDSPFHREGG
jgi:hypothetical protein